MLLTSPLPRAQLPFNLGDLHSSNEVVHRKKDLKNHLLTFKAERLRVNSVIQAWNKLLKIHRDKWYYMLWKNQVQRLLNKDPDWFKLLWHYWWRLDQKIFIGIRSPSVLSTVLYVYAFTKVLSPNALGSGGRGLTGKSFGPGPLEV